MVKAPTTKPDGLSWIPGTHVMKEENQFLKIVLWLYGDMHTAEHTSHKINTVFKNVKYLGVILTKGVLIVVNPRCQPDLIWKRHTSGCIYEEIAREVYWRREDLPWRWVASFHGLDPRLKKLEEWGSQASTSCALLPDCRSSVTTCCSTAMSSGCDELYLHTVKIFPTTKWKITYSRTNIGKTTNLPIAGFVFLWAFGGRYFNI